MKKLNFKRRLFPLIVICVMFFVIVPSVSAQSGDSGEQLSNFLLESDNPIDTWTQFSNSEKNSVKKFAESAMDKIQELKEKDLDNNELTNEIDKLSSDLQTAIHVSNLAVSTETTKEINNISLLSPYSVSHILTYEGVLGNELARLTHNISWSSNGSSVTDGDTNVIVDTPGLGWRYEGLIRNDQELTSTAYNSDVQGHFSYNVGNVNVQNWYPRSQIVGYPDGSYDYTAYN